MKKYVTQKKREQIETKKVHHRNQKKHSRSLREKSSLMELKLHFITFMKWNIKENLVINEIKNYL